MKSSTWCINAFHSLSAGNDGTTRPCCMFIGSDKNTSAVLGEQSISEHFNQPDILKLRKDLNNDIRNPQCNRCWEEEDGGRESKRIRDNKKWNGQTGLVFVELNLGNQCNIRCRTCGPHASSQWIEEAYDTKYKHVVPIKEYKTLVKKFSRSYEEDSPFWDDIETHLHTIKHLEFYGGEPLMSKKMWWILERAVELGYSHNIEIHYATNGTLWPKQVEIWKKFKKVSLSFSIDGIGPQFEYMRHLADWNTVHKNVITSTTFSANMQLNWCVTLSTLNIYYLDEIIKEYYKNYEPKGVTLYLNLVHNPQHFNIGILPEHIKQIVLEKLNAIPKEYTLAWSYLTGVIGFITNGTPDPSEWDIFLKELKIHDDYRNESYNEIFPEFAKLIGYEK